MDAELVEGAFLSYIDQVCALIDAEDIVAKLQYVDESISKLENQISEDKQANVYELEEKFDTLNSKLDLNYAILSEDLLHAYLNEIIVNIETANREEENAELVNQNV